MREQENWLMEAVGCKRWQDTVLTESGLTNGSTGELTARVTVMMTAMMTQD
jgi:hypothetical protein